MGSWDPLCCMTVTPGCWGRVWNSASLRPSYLSMIGVDQYSTPIIERYDGLNEAEFQTLPQQPGVTVIQHSGSQDPMMSGQSLHDVQVRIVDPNGKVCITGVPSEEYRICVDHKSI